MEYEYKNVKCTELKLDPSYQRALNDAHLKKIVKNYDNEQVRTLIVSERDNGDLYIVDGNHTRLATMSVHGANATLLAKVYKGLRKEEEAKLFVQLNTNSKKTTYNDELKAKFAMNDTLIVDYVDALNRSRLHWSFANGRSKWKNFIAHKAGVFCFKTYGEKAFVSALNAMDALIDYRLCGAKILYGVCYVLANTGMTENDIANTLRKIGKDEWEKQLKIYTDSVAFGGSPSLKASFQSACALLDFYNQNKRQKNKIFIAPSSVSEGG